MSEGRSIISNRSHSALIWEAAAEGLRASVGGLKEQVREGEVREEERGQHVGRSSNRTDQASNRVGFRFRQEWPRLGVPLPYPAIQCSPY